MLLNSKGKVVNLPADAKEYQLIPLREVLVPQPFPKNKMFSIEARARFKN